MRVELCACGQNSLREDPRSHELSSVAQELVCVRIEFLNRIERRGGTRLGRRADQLRLGP